MRRVAGGHGRLCFEPASETTRDPSTLLVDQGTRDKFLDEQLKPELLAAACEASGQRLELRMREGYDHSYYFVASIGRSMMLTVLAFRRCWRSRSPWSRRYLEHGTNRMINYEKLGSGPRGVVVLNDWLCDTSTWSGARVYLDLDRFSWVFADLRGYTSLGGMFANIQTPGVTFAITGPWRRGAL